MSTQPILSRDRIRRLLAELGEELEAHGVQAEMFVVGGAALALAYNQRRMTADVDAVFEPKTVVYAAAARIAERHEDVPPDWLNDGVKGFLPGPDRNAIVALETPGLVVRTASPEYLLALKVQASRVDRDVDDIRFLAGLCGVSTAEGVLSIATRVLGHENLAPKASYVVQELFAATTAQTPCGAEPAGGSEP